MSGLVSRIHQGQYDTEKELLNLRNNAQNEKRTDVLDAVNQRLKKSTPKFTNGLLGRYKTEQEILNINVTVITLVTYMKFIKIS